MKRTAVVACWLWGMVGCGARPQLILPDIHVAGGGSVGAVLAAHPLAASDTISALPLGGTDSLSFHLIQIRDRERPHLHATHDLVVTLLRGQGHLYIRGRAHAMRAGDVGVVPRETAHYFVNSGCTPAAAFVTFTPPYDGKDQVPVNE